MGDRVKRSLTLSRCILSEEHIQKIFPSFKLAAVIHLYCCQVDYLSSPKFKNLTPSNIQEIWLVKTLFSMYGGKGLTEAEKAYDALENFLHTLLKNRQVARSLKKVKIYENRVSKANLGLILKDYNVEAEEINN